MRLATSQLRATTCCTAPMWTLGNMQNRFRELTQTRACLTGCAPAEPGRGVLLLCTPFLPLSFTSMLLLFSLDAATLARRDAEAAVDCSRRDAAGWAASGAARSRGMCDGQRRLLCVHRQMGAALGEWASTADEATRITDRALLLRTQLQVLRRYRCEGDHGKVLQGLLSPQSTTELNLLNPQVTRSNLAPPSLRRQTRSGGPRGTVATTAGTTRSAARPIRRKRPKPQRGHLKSAGMPSTPNHPCPQVLHECTPAPEQALGSVQQGGQIRGSSTALGFITP